MRIVIIDDEPKIRKGLGKILSRHPGWYVAASFAEAESAMEYLAREDADVVITDIHMPEVTGLELIEGLRGVCRTAAFVILSGYARFEYAQRAIDLGVKKYLMKPTSPEELTQALEQIEADRAAAASAPAPAQSQVSNLLVRRAQEYIDLHYRSRCSLREVADALYISPNYLSNLFRKHTGMRFSDYLLEVRMEKSRQYLMDVHYRVGDVSALVGFGDPRYFSATFRKKYGMTPLEFRNHYAAGTAGGAAGPV
nr:response regulator [uncultured Dysosmobacter sp.]